MKTVPPKPVRLELPAIDHERLRILAASQGLPMSVLAREVILGWTEKEFRKLSEKLAK